MGLNERSTYCVLRIHKSGRESTIARNIDTLTEAAELALRLTKLQEIELGGDEEFTATKEQ